MSEQTVNQQEPIPVKPILLSGKTDDEKLKELTDHLEQGVREVFESEAYRRYLTLMSRFYTYSFRNSLLIAMQKPDATLVRGYNAWRNDKEIGRHVKAQEKGIRIVVPKEIKIQKEQQKRDPDTNEPLFAPDGSPVMETVEIKIPKFGVGYVYDVSQTEGKELPTLGVDELTGNVQDYPLFLESLKRMSPFPIDFETIESGAHGYANYEEKRIAIQEGMSELQTLKTAIHEISHATLHDIDVQAVTPEQMAARPDRRTREVQAESIAYVVCKHYGLDTGDYSFGYVAGWSDGKEMTELQSSLTTIQKTAKKLIEQIDETFLELNQAQELAAALDQFAEEHDPYEYRDTVGMKAEEHIQVIYRQLTEDDPTRRIGIAAYLQEIIEDGTDIDGKAAALLEQVNAYLPKEPSMPEKALETAPAKDTYTIYQLKEDVPRDYHFRGYRELTESGLSVTPDNYQKVYEGTLEPGMTLNGLWETFNLNHPEDFTGHSLSMSDIVVLKQDGAETAHYVDTIGYADVTEPFLHPERAAEQTASYDEAAYHLDQETYLYVQTSEDGYDYTLYDRQFQEIDGGQLDNPDLSIEAARDEILALHELSPTAIDPIPLEEYERLPELIGKEPTVTINFSESGELENGTVLPFSEANPLFEQLDRQTRERYGTSGYYDKTDFTIEYVADGRIHTYTGRQDLGDLDGSLTDHILKHATLYRNDPTYQAYLLEQGKEAQEQANIGYDDTIQKFVPYLKLHENLAVMERRAAEAMEQVIQANPVMDVVMVENLNYYEAIIDYAQKSRMELNTAVVPQLPDMPQVQDHIKASTEEYREQVEMEIEQEALDAGMTVEEYAANGYEPYPVFEVRSAAISNYEGMDVFIGRNGYVYIGNRENYDNHGHYDNRDSSMLFLSENPKMFDLLRGEGYTMSQEEMLRQGIFTREDFREFDFLRTQMLSHLTPTREILFAGKPFQPENPLETTEKSTEQNFNMIDGSRNNMEPEETPHMDALEEKANAGEQISLMDMVDAIQKDQAAATRQQEEEKKEEPTAEEEKETEPATTAPYYSISESAARRAKAAYSMSDYKEGSATAEYRHYVDEAVELAERQKKKVDPMYHEKIDHLVDVYARKLAENMNHRFAIEARVPSILIAGGSNFPVRQKEKQVAAEESNYREWKEIQGLLDKIRSTGMGGISADDPNAIEKLEAKLAALQKSQETMKAVNAYYRKHKTLDGCPDLKPEQIERLKENLSQSIYEKPFPSYSLSNNNAEIRRLKQRIESLKYHQEIDYPGWEFEGGKVVANKEANRLQVLFDEKPDADIRSELKSNGFRWSPKENAWQRQLNQNAYYAADSVQAIQPLTGEKPSRLRRKALAEKKPSIRSQLKENQEQLKKTEPDKKEPVKKPDLALA